MPRPEKVPAQVRHVGHPMRGSDPVIRQPGCPRMLTLLPLPRFPDGRLWSRFLAGSRLPRSAGSWIHFFGPGRASACFPPADFWWIWQGKRMG
jgi:hypothetical protein